MKSKTSVTSKDMVWFFLLILKQVDSSVSLPLIIALKFLLILHCRGFEFCKQGSFVEPFTFKKCPWAEHSANLSWNSALITFWEIRSCLWCLWEWQHQAGAGCKCSTPECAAVSPCWESWGFWALNVYKSGRDADICYPTKESRSACRTKECTVCFSNLAQTRLWWDTSIH